MKKFVGFIVAQLFLIGACLAQQGLTVQSGKQKWPVAEAQKIYAAACLVVAQEYRVKQTLNPNVKLILGAEKEDVWLEGHEIRLSTTASCQIMLAGFLRGKVKLKLAERLWERRSRHAYTLPIVAC